MASFIVKHGDMTRMENEELRLLQNKWNRMSNFAIKTSTAVVAVLGIGSASGLTMFIIELFTLSVQLSSFSRFFPFMVFLLLLWSISRMKYQEYRGFVSALVLEICVFIVLINIGVGSSASFEPLFIVAAFLTCIPIVLNIRCICNYRFLRELKKIPGYPYFTYTMYQKFSPYIKNEEMLSPKEDENFVPWNAFDEQSDDKEDKDETKGEDTNDNENKNPEKGNDI